jgi:peptidoglycan/xylan/chitin deacetylase (PgdA/CDA1 family)
MTTRTVCVTVDAEPDCPPFLWGWRGMEEGAPQLLELFRAERIPATFFVTGDAAHRYPDFVEELLADDHELGSHGMTHTPLPSLSQAGAEREIRETSAMLRAYAPVTAFRAPNLRLPDRCLPLLEADGYRVDSSLGRYKPAHWRRPGPTSLTRIPASVTSSWLRLPPGLRNPVLRRLRSPVVLFVHPWEFVDLRSAPIRWDCRAGTGPAALDSLRSVIRLFKNLGASFTRISDAAEAASARAGT